MSTIKIYSNQYTAGALTMENTGNLTRQDINNFLDEKGITYNDSKVVVRQSKVELSYPESQVPAGDIHIMISTAKTKAGLNAEDFLDESGKASGTRIVRALAALSQEVAAMKAELKSEIDALRDEVASNDSDDDFEDEEEFDFEDEDEYAHLSDEDREAFEELNNL